MSGTCPSQLGLLLALVLAYTPTQQAHETPRQHNCAFLPDSDFPGYDYVTLRPGQRGHDGTLTGCATACFKLPMCRAWSLRPDDSDADDAGSCYLKTNGTVRESSPGLVSGLPCVPGYTDAFGNIHTHPDIMLKEYYFPSEGLLPGYLTNTSFHDSRLIWGDVGFNDSIWLVSIGSMVRQEFQEIQRNTIGHHFRLFTFDENTVPKCVFCPKGASGREPPDEAMRKRESGGANYGNGSGWMCAQKRVLPALELVLSSTSAINFPAFLLIIDDDTLVNAHRLLEFTATLDPGVPLYTGQLAALRDESLRIVGRKLPFINGGGGSLLSRAVLLLLNGAGIRKCRNNVQGGEWCDWNSDWSLAQCIREMAGTYPSDQPPGLFNQYGGLKYCNKNAITCHEHLTVEDFDSGGVVFEG